MLKHLSLIFLFFLMYLACFATIYLRSEIILLGYDLGKLKAQETALLQTKSLLTVKLAQKTSKEYLQKVTQAPDKKDILK